MVRTADAESKLMHHSGFPEGHDPQRLHWVEEDLAARESQEGKFDYFAACAVTLIQRLNPERIDELIQEHIDDDLKRVELTAYYIEKTVAIYRNETELALETIQPYLARLQGLRSE